MDWGKVERRIPEGSVLGPFIFVLFINDLLGDILSSIVVFADDTKLWSKVNNTDDKASLQFKMHNLNLLDTLKSKLTRPTKSSG